MSELLRVLLLQSWVIPGSELRAVLGAGGYEVKVFRVDFEPALVAALSRQKFDVILLDTRSTGLTLARVEAVMRECGVQVPVVELGAPSDLAAAVRGALAAVRN